MTASRQFVPITMLFGVVALVGLIGGPLLFAQDGSPVNANKSPSVWSPIGGASADASTSIAKAPVELTEEDQGLRVDRLMDNQDELQFQAPALSSINESALGIETESIRRNISSAAVEASGGYTSNLYNQSVNQVGSGFGRYSFPLTFSLSKPRARFAASYLPQLVTYSAASGIYQTHVYNQTLLYSLSPRTTLSWQLTGARYRDVGQFLPTILSTGGTGIAQPTSPGSNIAGISTVSNAATSVGLLQNLSRRDNIILTGTAAWNELAQAFSSPQAAVPQSILRNQSFVGDAIYEHAMDASTFIGVDGTAAYVRGLSNLTGLHYQTILGTLRYSITPYDSFSVGAGPLFLDASGGPTTTVQNAGTTYALKVQYTHQSRIATVSGSYARVLQLSLDNTAAPANQFSGTFLRPVTKHFDVTIDLRYIHTGSDTTESRETNFGGTLRLDYRMGSRLGWFATASDTHSSQPETSTTTANFNRSEISGGLRFALDHKPAR